MSLETVGIENSITKRIGAARIYISMPFIYAMIIPLVFLDICLEVYHHFCFPLYGIPVVPRRRYIRIDRHRLQYLTGVSKLNCLYCGYGNGLLHYASVIAAMTELYWCPIQHKVGEDFSAPRHHHRFAKYGEVESLKAILKEDRTSLTAIGE